MAPHAGPNTVFVAKPSDLSYGQAMSHLRMWLDHHKIEPASFRLAADGRIGFEISFHHDHEIAVFDEFEWLRRTS